MSTDRENVTWQSKDGTWNRAFFDFYETGDPSDEDFDYEWDVEYTEQFNWLVSGLPTEVAADEAWEGSNPGGTSIHPYDADDKWIIKLEAEAARFKAARAERLKADHADYFRR